METRTINDIIDCSGALIFSKVTKRFLLLQKKDGKHSKTWGLVGELITIMKLLGKVFKEKLLKN